MSKELYLKITRPQNVCVKCGAAINQEGHHPSAIFSASTPTATGSEEDEAVLRQDFCPTCWQEVVGTDYYSFWLAKRERPKTRKIQNRKERNTTLLAYFDYLYQQNDAVNAQHLFFLAHLLMKFSVFKWVRTEPAVTAEGRERVVFRNTVTDDYITIESVTMEEERLVAIKREVDEFLARAVIEVQP